MRTSRPKPTTAQQRYSRRGGRRLSGPTTCRRPTPAGQCTYLRRVGDDRRPRRCARHSSSRIAYEHLIDLLAIPQERLPQDRFLDGAHLPQRAVAAPVLTARALQRCTPTVSNTKSSISSAPSRNTPEPQNGDPMAKSPLRRRKSASICGAGRSRSPCRSRGSSRRSRRRCPRRARAMRPAMNARTRRPWSAAAR